MMKSNNGHSIIILDEPTDWWKKLSEAEKEVPELKGFEKIFSGLLTMCPYCHMLFNKHEVGLYKNGN